MGRDRAEVRLKTKSRLNEQGAKPPGAMPMATNLSQAGPWNRQLRSSKSAIIHPNSPPSTPDRVAGSVTVSGSCDFKNARPAPTIDHQSGRAERLHLADAKIIFTRAVVFHVTTKSVKARSYRIGASCFLKALRYVI
jgi:hypothetical protein